MSTANHGSTNSWKGLLGKVLILCTGTSLAHVIMLGISPILTRLFSPTSFAVFGFHQAALAVVTMLLTLQFEGAIPIPKSERQAGVLFSLSLKFGFLLTLILTAAILTWGMWPHPAWDWLPVSVLALIPLCAFGEALARCYRSLSIRNGRFNDMSAVRVAQAVVTAGSHLVTGGLGWVTLGLPLGDAVGRWVSTAWAVRLSQHSAVPHNAEAPYTWAEYREALREYLRFPLLVTPGVVLAMLVNMLPALALPSLHGREFAGQFALANRAVLLPLMIISQAVTAVYVSRASQLVREQDTSLRQLIRTTAGQMAGLGLILGLIAAVSGPLLFPMVFGPNWTISGQIVPYLALSGFAQFVGGPVNQVLVLLGGETRKFAVHCVGFLAVMAALFGTTWLGWGPFQTTATYALTILSVQGLYLWQSLVLVDHQVSKWEQNRSPTLSLPESRPPRDLAA